MKADTASKPSELLKRMVSCLEIRMAGLALLIAVALAILSPYFLTANNLLQPAGSVGGHRHRRHRHDLRHPDRRHRPFRRLDRRGVTGIIFGLALREFPIPVAMILAILSGDRHRAVFSGILIGYFGMAAFVVTLGVMAIGRSLAYIFSGQQPISDVPEDR